VITELQDMAEYLIEFVKRDPHVMLDTLKNSSFHPNRRGEFGNGAIVALEKILQEKFDDGEIIVGDFDMIKEAIENFKQLTPEEKGNSGGGESSNNEVPILQQAHNLAQNSVQVLA
jgi:hypothetical protein